MLNGLDLFSGIGGGAYALAPWVKPVAYCENDEYAQGVLLERQCQGEIPVAPIWDDIRTLTSEHLPFPVDIIYGGFPCQDISVAGAGAGLEGKRSVLFFEVLRLAKEIQPSFVLLENVPALRTRGLFRVIQELSAAGYVGRAISLSALEVGANHKRDRVWILAAHAERLKLWNEQGRSSGTDREGPAFPRNDGEAGPLADSPSNGRDQWRSESESTREAKFGFPSGQGVGQADTNGAGLEGPGHAQAAWQALAQFGFSGEQPRPSGIPKPSLRRGADGLQNRVDRLKGLGNAWVPLQAQEAFRRLMGIREGA